MLSREDYQLIEIKLDNKQFLQPLDADNTKASIYYIRQKFIRYALRLGFEELDQVELTRDRYYNLRHTGH